MPALPVHPRTGLSALGIVGGRPVWPVLGARQQEPPGQQQTGGQQAPPAPQPGGPEPPGQGQGGQQCGQDPNGQRTGQDPAGQAAQPAEPNRVDDLPEWAQRLIRDTRAEAAQHRTAHRDAEAQRQATLDAVAQALGVQTGNQPDPEALTADLAAARAESWQRAVDLAVYRTAGQHGGDPSALLDSRGFQQRAADLDPDAADFTDRIGAAIKAAVAENPRLAATPTGSVGQQQRDMGQGRRDTGGAVGVQAGRDLYAQRHKPSTS